MVDIYGLGLRDAILLIAGGAAVYLVYLWLKLMQVKKRKQAGRKKAAAPAAQKVERQEVSVIESDSDEDLDVVYDRPRTPMLAPVPDRIEVRDNDNRDFERFMAESQQRQQKAQAVELKQLREEVVTLRESLQSMKTELDRLKASSAVSPLYSEAVGMAQHGLNAEGIADRCGISIAEAELVAALVRKPSKDSSESIDVDYHDRKARYAA